MRFNFTISNVPGKKLVIADTLSRAPASLQTAADQDFLQEANFFVKTLVENCPYPKTESTKSDSNN